MRTHLIFLAIALGVSVGLFSLYEPPRLPNWITSSMEHGCIGAMALTLGFGRGRAGSKPKK